MNDYRSRIKAVMRQQGEEWFRIQAKSDSTTRVDIYDEISVWGLTAADLVNQLKDVNTKTIELHINSPGGDVWDGITIYNALRDHPAKVNVVVDGIAASAASFVAQAGDTVTMNRNSELMIHDGWGFCMGNAADMLDMAKRLDKSSNNIASIYADRAGGTVGDWRNAMEAETWYSAQEAVDAGLADSVVDGKRETDDESSTNARFDLSVFNHAGRSEAPTPGMYGIRRSQDKLPQETKRNSTNSEEKNLIYSSNSNNDPLPFRTNEQGDTLTAEQLQALGLPEDASSEQISDRIAALTALEAQTSADAEEDSGEAEGESSSATDDETQVGDGAEVSSAEGASTASTATAPIAPQPLDENSANNSVETVTIDRATWENVQGSLRQVASLVEEKRVATRNALLNQAIKDAKFEPARAAHWAKLYDADPEGTKATIASLEPNLIPLREVGHGNDVVDQPQDSYPDSWLAKPRTGKAAS